METLVLRATLKGHNGWVTSIATSPETPDTILTSSRDKTVIVWELTRDEDYGFAKRALKGHNHFVQDVVISSDGAFALSASWGTYFYFSIQFGSVVLQCLCILHCVAIWSARSGSFNVYQQSILKGILI